MTRLAFQLSDQDQDRNFRAAASRIHLVTVVEFEDSPDAIVSSNPDHSRGSQPTLFLGGNPPSQPNIFPAFPGRFQPDVMEIRQTLDSGKLGRPGLMRLHTWAPASQSQVDPARIAAVDLALCMFGETPDAIHCTSQGNRSEIIHLGFSSGGMALLDFTDALPEGEGYRSLSLICSHGAAYADDHRNRNLVFAGGSTGAFAPDYTNAFMRPMLEDFIDAVRKGRDSTEATRQYQDAQAVVRSQTVQQ